MIQNKEYQFLLDTGAQISCISKHVVDQLQLPLLDHKVSVSSFGGQMKSSAALLVDTLQIGDLIIHNQPCFVISSKYIKIPVVNQTLSLFDGIIGWDILSSFDFEFDNLNKKFHIFETTEIVPFENLIKGRFPMIVVKDDKKNTCVVGIDSGAQVSWVNTTIYNKSDDCKKAKIFAYGIHGFEKIESHIVKECRYKLGKSNIVLEKVNTGRTNIFANCEFDGILGNEIMKKRNLRFINSQNYVEIRGGKQ